MIRAAGLIEKNLHDELALLKKQLEEFERQIGPPVGEPFVKVGSVRSEVEKQIRADLMGFTRYALAY